jgi:RimJ/RimL family protein N-acetyltransferase
MRSMGALRSDRLELRTLDASDAAFLESLYASAQVTRTLLRIQGPISLEEAKEFCQAPARTAGDLRFGAALKADGRLVALGSVRRHAETPSVATIGYSVVPALWGKGLGTELAVFLSSLPPVPWALELQATTLDDNPASGRVLAKLGFTVSKAGASEVDSRGNTRPVTRWVLCTRSREGAVGRRTPGRRGPA